MNRSPGLLGLTPRPRKTSSQMGAGGYHRGYGDVNLSLYGSIRPRWFEEDEFIEFEEEFEEEFNDFDEEDDYYELIEFIDNQRW